MEWSVLVRVTSHPFMIPQIRSHRMRTKPRAHTVIINSCVILVNEKGVVASSSSGSGVLPAGRSKSPSHYTHNDGSFHGGDFLANLDEEGPSPPMIEWQPALEQLGGGIVGNATPPSRSNLPIVPRHGVA